MNDIQDQPGEVFPLDPLPVGAVRILDHGYILLVESMGSDEGIIEAARMSTGKGFLGWGERFECKTCKCLWRDNGDNTVSLLNPDKVSCPLCEGDTNSACKKTPGDEALLRRLWTKKHTSPFEMADFMIEVQLPLFVRSEWQRHRTQSFNEFSARYAKMFDLNYVPETERMFPIKDGDKQAGTVDGALALTPDAAENWKAMLNDLYDQAEFVYQRGLAQGVPKELARLVIPTGRYTKMRAKANLLNWLKFLSLRLDPAAQWEIRQYAIAVENIVKELYPRTWALFDEGRTK